MAFANRSGVSCGAEDARQYVGSRNEDPRLPEQVAQLLADPSTNACDTQSDARDFAPIATAFDMLLRSKGWLT